MSKPTGINSDEGIILIDLLKRIDGAINYDGDASRQVVFKLANGKNLRFGVTDDDVAETPGLWVDQYGGIAVVGGDQITRTPWEEERAQLLAACKEYREKLDALEKELDIAHQRAADEHGQA